MRIQAIKRLQDAKIGHLLLPHQPTQEDFWMETLQNLTAYLFKTCPEHRYHRVSFRYQNPQKPSRHRSTSLFSPLLSSSRIKWSEKCWRYLEQMMR